MKILQQGCPIPQLAEARVQAFVQMVKSQAVNAFETNETHPLLFGFFLNDEKTVRLDQPPFNWTDIADCCGSLEAWIKLRKPDVFAFVKGDSSLLKQYLVYVVRRDGVVTSNVFLGGGEWEIGFAYSKIGKNPITGAPNKDNSAARQAITFWEELRLSVWRGMGTAWDFPFIDFIRGMCIDPRKPAICASSALGLATCVGGNVESLTQFFCEAGRAGLVDCKILREELQDAGDLCNALHLMYRWAVCGLPVFELTSSLAAALTLTDPSGLRLEDVRLPFGTFFIRIPVPFWSADHPEGVRADVNGLWVHSYSQEMLNDKEAANPTRLRIVQTFAQNVREFIFDNTKGLDETIGEWINAETTDTPSDNPQVEAVSFSSDKEMTAACLRLVFNTALYVNECSQEKEGNRHPKQARGGRPKGPRVASVVLGREVKLGKALLNAARSRLAGDKREWRLTSRFVVRGHWRQQVCGKRDKVDGRYVWRERRLQWIAPYWKGEEGSVVQHVYKAIEDSKGGVV